MPFNWDSEMLIGGRLSLGLFSFLREAYPPFSLPTLSVCGGARIWSQVGAPACSLKPLVYCSCYPQVQRLPENQDVGDGMWDSEGRGEGARKVSTI